MRVLFTAVFILLGIACTAQTRRIAHRSHSGAKHERYDGTEGSYGKVAPRKVKVHLETGRDTMVYSWDSLARPYFLDTIRQKSYEEVGHKKIETAKEIGHVAGKLVM